MCLLYCVLQGWRLLPMVWCSLSLPYIQSTRDSRLLLLPILVSFRWFTYKGNKRQSFSTYSVCCCDQHLQELWTGKRDLLCAHCCVQLLITAHTSCSRQGVYILECRLLRPRYLSYVKSKFILKIQKIKSIQWLLFLSSHEICGIRLVHIYNYIYMLCIKCILNCKIIL